MVPPLSLPHLLSHPTLASLPFVGGVTHCLADVGLDPRHEWPIEPELRAALSPEEAAYILGVAIGTGDRRRAVDRIAVPVEGLHLRARAAVDDGM